MPALFSHSVRPHASVLFITLHGLASTLTPRLTTVASSELADISLELQLVNLRPNTPDSRLCRYTNKKPSNKGFYVNSFRHLQTDEQARAVWSNAAPLECKIFNWLARRHRLPTNDRQHRHNMTPSPVCPSCSLDEDVDHLLVNCFRAREVWRFFSNGGASPSSFLDLWSSRCRSPADTTICMAILWNIWKRRNALVFNAKDEPCLLSQKNALRTFVYGPINVIIPLLPPL
uniref:Uncharacterized protein n=1 Tax=Avena sativa TaxID=4498 RepID=A0ACD6AM72_AVESA